MKNLVHNQPIELLWLLFWIYSKSAECLYVAFDLIVRITSPCDSYVLPVSTSFSIINLCKNSVFSQWRVLQIVWLHFFCLLLIKRFTSKKNKWAFRVGYLLKEKQKLVKSKSTIMQKINWFWQLSRNEPKSAIDQLSTKPFNLSYSPRVFWSLFRWCCFVLQPSREAHPSVMFSCNNSDPLVLDNLPFDKYELEPSPLTQYILERKSPSTCWQVCILLY